MFENQTHISADATENHLVGQQTPNNAKAHAGAKNPLLKCHLCSATLKTMGKRHAHYTNLHPGSLSDPIAVALKKISDECPVGTEDIDVMCDIPVFDDDDLDIISV